MSLNRAFDVNFKLASYVWLRTNNFSISTSWSNMKGLKEISTLDFSNPDFLTNVLQVVGWNSSRSMSPGGSYVLSFKLVWPRLGVFLAISIDLVVSLRALICYNFEFHPNSWKALFSTMNFSAMNLSTQPEHKGAICQFPVRWIYYCQSS